MAAAQAVDDDGMVGKVNVTGLGLPSEMAGYVKAGCVQVLRDLEPDRPRLLRDHDRLQPGRRQGDSRSRRRDLRWAAWASVKLDDNGEGAMADPFVYDAKNVEEFAKIF